MYGVDTVNGSTCHHWFQKLRNGDRNRTINRVPNVHQGLLNIRCSTISNVSYHEESVEMLWVHGTTVERRVHASEFTKKLGQWVLHHVSEKKCQLRASIYVSLLSQFRSETFLKRVATDDGNSLVTSRGRTMCHEEVPPGRTMYHAEVPPIKIMHSLKVLCVWWNVNGTILW